MPVEITNGSIAFATVTLLPPDFSRFTALVKEHLLSVAGTPWLEEQGCRLYQNDFPKPDLGEFISDVCRWGGYPGIAGRVLKSNSITDIRQQFLDAKKVLQEPQPDVRVALRIINQVSGLGKPSFASKHLRFLRPDICPVLDSRIVQELVYPYDADGYKQWSDDCLRIATMLETQGIHNTMNRPGGTWFAADVEMALFAHISSLDSLLAGVTAERIHPEIGTEEVVENEVW